MPRKIVKTVPVQKYEIVAVQHVVVGETAAQKLGKALVVQCDEASMPFDVAEEIRKAAAKKGCAPVIFVPMGTVLLLTKPARQGWGG